MKLLAVASVMCSTAVVAAEPYYLISHGIADSSVIAVYGWPDNKKPCESLARHMNRTMEEEKNHHRFACGDEGTAMQIDCKSTASIDSDCVRNWQARHELLRTLKPR
jgi:hypothetical protein